MGSPGAILAVLEAILAVLEAILAVLEAVLEAILGHLGAVLGEKANGRHLEPSFAVGWRVGPKATGKDLKRTKTVKRLARRAPL